MGYHPESLVRELSETARDLRLDVIEMITRAGSGHPGGSLSAADIVAALFFHHMRLDPDRPDWPERDRFILSKGHAAPILYAALARRGFFPREELWTLRQCDSILQGHPDCRKTPGVDMTSGSLGHGICLGAGLALGLRADGNTARVYVLVGDGEMQAGIIWEGLMTAAKYRLANLTVIMDFNNVQLDGFMHQVMPLEPVLDKWRAFGWHVIEIDGHNLSELVESLDQAGDIHDRPTAIVAHTTKGKGVSFMENRSAWHGGAPNEEQYRQAIAELVQAQ
jgi:transketolase